MFDNLSERLERSFKILKGEGKITEIKEDSRNLTLSAVLETDVKIKNLDKVLVTVD